MSKLHPKSARLLLTAMLLTGAGAAQAASTKKAPAKPLNVAILVFPDVEVLDFSGPLDVFVKANLIAPGSYNVYTVAPKSGPVVTQGGALTIQPRYTLSNSPRTDIVVVPGSSPQSVRVLGQDRVLIQWLQREAGRSQLTMSVCTGAFVLGQAGLLDGKKSTTHWLSLVDLQKQFPRTTAIKDTRFVSDGKLLTTAGITSGIDGALYVIEKRNGKHVADVVSDLLQYRRGTPAYPASTTSAVSSKPTAKNRALQPKAGPKLSSLVDPVCGMMVEANTKLTYSYKGHLYGFCAEHCRHEFVANPTKYLSATR